MGRPAKAAKKTFKCNKCDRTFAMRMHLARHESAAHGVKARKGKRGRPTKGQARQAALRNLTIEQLSELMKAARAEIRQRMADLEIELR